MDTSITDDCWGMRYNRFIHSGQFNYRRTIQTVFH